MKSFGARLRRASLFLSTALLLGAPAPAPPEYSLAAFPPDAVPLATAGFSVMTYNVGDLPWPLRAGRGDSLDIIAARLAELRRKGRQPRMVVLQEAFSDRARRIGSEAGYRYRALGPARGADGDAPGPAGERVGRLLGSGLAIFSDFPIRSVRRLPFPADACAGFDCLANKGMVLALVEVPGAPDPVGVVNLHLNSRRQSGVSIDRADEAFRRQLEAIAPFLKAHVPPGSPLILAGDFNVGTSAVRRRHLEREARLWQLGRPGAIQEALSLCARIRSAVGGSRPAGGAFSLKCEKDRQFLLPGRRTAFGMTSMAIPFRTDQVGDRLSDHIGYIVYYGRP